MKSRTFSLAALLQISTGIALPEGNLDAIFEILSFAAGESLFIHSLGRVADEFKPLLLEQHPFLIDIPAGSFKDKSEDEIKQRLAELKTLHGDSFEVFPMHSEDHVSLLPAVELAMNHPKLPIMEVNLDTGEVTLDGDV